jgi:type III secretion system chaperone SycN
VNWLEQTLHDFGRQLGLGELRLDGNNSAELALGQGGTLGFEHAGGEVLVYLSRPLDYDTAAAYEEALRACDFRDSPAYALQAGVRGERELVLLARVPERQFTASALEQVLDILVKLHERVRNA